MASLNDPVATREKPVWLITGCSTGFGRELAQLVLALGYRTVVIARNPEALNDLADKGDALLIKLDVKAGDRVLFSKYAGTEVKIDGVEHLIMREDDILGIIEK